MTIRPSLLAALPLALLAAVAVDAAADRRAFTHTYEYLTIADGETELQLYSDQRRTTFGDDAVETFGLRLELGHGITERWEVALRHGFEQTSGPAVTDVVRLHLTDVELRTRYRFADRGDGPLDLAVQARAAKLFGDSVYVLEGEVILARDLGLATIAVQPIVRVAVGSDVAGTDVELGWAAGVTYEASAAWKLGAETWGWVVDELDVVEASAGPAVSWQPTSRLWVTVTAGFGLDDDTDRLDVRGIVGLAL